MAGKILIIIPAYNEEKRIGNTLEEYANFFTEKIKSKEVEDFEIIVVINNTKDKTEEIVRKAGKKYRQIKYLNFKQGGKGFAIIEGFKEALKHENELIGFVDADMATTPEAFYELVEKINGYDGAIASRWLKGSVIKTKQTIMRIITSRGFNFLVRALLFLSYKDTQCGAKLFKRKAVQSIIGDIGITKWAFDIDLLFKMKRKGFNIKEIPTIWEDKKESKLDLFRTPLQMFLALVRLRLIYSPLRFLVRLYDKMPEYIKFHHRV
jgi:glycosyltransferase involved in cell wall biosynthesis